MSEAIAKNLSLLSNLKTPVIVIITGEGGSGGALAIGVGDHVCMLEHSIYAVASPEACASIVWRDGSKAKDAAEAMKVDASSLQNLGLVDQVIKEPLGGAHRDLRGVSNSISKVIEEKLLTFDEIDISDFVERLTQGGHNKTVALILASVTEFMSNCAYRVIRSALMDLVGENVKVIFVTVCHTVSLRPSTISCAVESITVSHSHDFRLLLWRRHTRPPERTGSQA